MNLNNVIHALGLKRHPEGGFYAETHRITAPEGQRSPGTAIYYALGEGDRSHWHRVDATEIWHFYAGAPLELSLSPGNGVTTHLLGPDLAAGQRPQVIVPIRHWQAARRPASGRSSAARCRRALSLLDSRWPRRTGSRRLRAGSPEAESPTAFRRRRESASRKKAKAGKRTLMLPPKSIALYVSPRCEMQSGHW